MNLGPSKEMPQYRCHKVVRAAKITEVNIVEVDQPGKPLVVELVLGDIGVWTAPVIWNEQHKPFVGGYLVEYEDGYRSYSPAKAFEEGYTNIETPAVYLGRQTKAIGMYQLPPVSNSIFKRSAAEVYDAMAQEGWQFIGLIPGEKHAIAEHCRPAVAMFVRPGTGFKSKVCGSGGGEHVGKERCFNCGESL